MFCEVHNSIGQRAFVLSNGNGGFSITSTSKELVQVGGDCISVIYATAQVAPGSNIELLVEMLKKSIAQLKNHVVKIVLNYMGINHVVTNIA